MYNSRSTCPETQRIQASACGFPIRNQSNLVRRVQWSGFSLAVLTVALRFAARLPVMNGVGDGWDDLTILACLMTAVASNVLLSFSTLPFKKLTLSQLTNPVLEEGLGQDVWMSSPRNINHVLKFYWISAFLYVSIMNGIKVSIVLLYLRLFPAGVTKWFTSTCYLLIGMLVASALAINLSTAVACSPVAYYWLRWDGEHRGSCVNTTAQIFAGGGINISFDLVVFFVPLPLLVRLNISTYKKIGVCLTFTVGLFVTVCSVVRLQYLVHWGQSQNPTWDHTPVAIWSTVEANFGMICACMPPLARPLKRLWKRVVDLAEYISFAFDSTTVTSGLPTRRNDPQVQAEPKGFFDNEQHGNQSRSLDDVELSDRPASPASSSRHCTRPPVLSNG